VTAATFSMTGTGAAAGLTEAGPLRIELRSVNGRALQVKQRLCREVSGLESVFEDEIRGKVVRGSVTLAVDRSAPGKALPDRARLAQMVADLRSLAREVGVSDALTLRDVLDLAGDAPTAIDREHCPQVLALLRAAVADLQAHRAQGGRDTVAAMLADLDAMDLLREEAVRRAPAIVDDHRQKLLTRLREFVASQGLDLDEGALVREVGLFAERVDVQEELQRLGAHLRETRSVLSAGGAVGRKVEFLLQEVLRETNTLGSKSPDVAMAHCVVAMKSAIDRLKEQAANLE